MPILPPVTGLDEYRAALKDRESFVSAAREVARLHGLGDLAPERFAGGSTPVLALGDALVAKFFGPIFRDLHRAEGAALRHVEGRLPVATPALVASGEVDGWGYVVMRRLPGRELREAWDEMGEEDRRAAVRRAGEVAAALHAIPVEGIDAALRVHWGAFTRRQREGAVEQHRGKGLDEAWLRQIPAWLETVELEPGDVGAAPVLLHTELMRDHFLVERRGEGWEVTGLLDFEPSMVGHRDYEMASVGLFVSGGDPALLSAFLEGYGVEPGRVTPEARRRWLAWALLHRYGNLRWYLERMPEPERPTLDALAARWWATE